MPTLYNEEKPDELLPGGEQITTSSGSSTDGISSNTPTQTPVRPPQTEFNKPTLNSPTMVGNSVFTGGWLRSANFVAGVSGWEINAEGNVEFQDATIRGTLYALLGTIGGWTIGSTTLTGGNITLDQANNKITIGSGSNQITIDGATGVISSNGSSWTISGSGQITGFGKMYITTTPVTVSSTTTETDLISFSLPASTLGTGSAVRATVYFSAFGATFNKTATIRCKYGATTLITWSSTNLNNTSATLGKLEFIIFGDGATNAQKGDLRGFGVNNGLGLLTQSNQTQFIGIAGTGTSAEDSTAAKTFAISVQFNNSSANDIFTMSTAVIERIT